MKKFIVERKLAVHNNAGFKSLMVYNVPRNVGKDKYHGCDICSITSIKISRDQVRIHHEDMFHTFSIKYIFT